MPDSTSPRARPCQGYRTRRAEFDLASGQSFAIAGLMENNASQNASRVPALGTSAIGALFRSQAFKRGQTRTRHHRDPGHRQPDLGHSTPIDNYVPPNDFERILLGRFQGSPRGREAVQKHHRPALARPLHSVFK